METLLERAKGSPLTVLSSYLDPSGTITPFPLITEQIKHLDFVYSRQVDIRRFSEVISGPLPLHTPNITAVQGISQMAPTW